MAMANTLVGDFGSAPDVLYSGSADRTQPFNPGMARAATVAPDANRIANYVAFLVLLSLTALILIRIGGLQGMIAVGRS